MPDIDAARADYPILGWALEPGDAIAFDFAIVHGAPATTTAQNRGRVFSAPWVGDGAVFADRRGKGSPPFPHLTLADGEPSKARIFRSLSAADESPSDSRAVF